MIRLENVSIRSGDFVLADLSFSIPHGYYAVLTGSSGSGKTTILEALCGLRTIEGGAIWLADRKANSLSPGERGIGYVPQDSALFESMTVREQIAFAPRLKSQSREVIDEKIREYAAAMKIENLLDRYPGNLSGGEKKRVALARAMSADPKILCLDEPLTALDDDARDELLELLVGLKGIVTVLHVTHNRRQTEQIADIKLILGNGEIKKVDRFTEDLA